MRFAMPLKLAEVPVIWPGLLSAITFGLAATFVSEHQGGPQLLYALFFGMAFNFAAEGPKIRPGIDFASRQVLRFGVALLGARITLEQLGSIGLGPILLVIAAVALTILFGAALGRLLRQPAAQAVLAGGAVAICGASAALAISAVLPRNEENQRFLLFTVVGVTTLSTVAMIAYPAVARALGLDGADAAVFLGGTIHDVAQVVAAGYMFSPQVGDAATFVKLLRVAMLLPAVLVIGLVFRAATMQSHAGAGDEKQERPPLLPGFLVGFAVLVALNSAGMIPTAVSGALSGLSRWCLVVAIAALGVKTSFQQLARLGWRPAFLLVANTVFLALFVLGGIYWRHA